MIEPESPKSFISRMVWLIAEIEASDKGSTLDSIKLLEYHLRERDGHIVSEAIKDVRVYVYGNVDGYKQTRFTNWLDKYENQKQQK
tara:strand:+ start:96 stop:353 length:258 start_codon:yes stop_codon:yes gene_type:complete